jgi:Uma2 family endonuclease
MSSLAQTYYTSEEYLALERKAEYKSEYINGQIYAMSGASREHILISVNLASELRTQVRGRPCEVYNSDMRVKVNPTGMYTYPDVSVVCGKPVFDDTRQDTLNNPSVIIEVLSPSTEAYDRGEKFAHYQRLSSLVDYVLVSQDKVRVEHYVRQNEVGDEWHLTAISDLHGVLHLTSIDCSVALRDIYERVEFPEAPQSRDGASTNS